MTQFVQRLFCVSWFVFALTLASQAGGLENEKGSGPLERAVAESLAAESLPELTDVIKLCQDALTQGLNDKDKTFAEKLLAMQLVRRAQWLEEGMLRLSEAGPQARPQILQLARQAFADLELAIRSNPHQFDAHLALGRLNTLPGGDHARALTALGEAVRLDPSQPDAFRLRGLVLLQAGKTEEALADFDRAIAADPRLAVAHELRGTALAMLRRWDPALEAFGQALKVRPRSPSALLQRARVYAAKNDSAAMLADLNAALVMQPNNTGGLVLRANLNEQLGKLEPALADLNTLVKLQPQAVGVHRSRAVLLARLGRLDAKIAELEKAAAEPDAAAATLHGQLGVLYAFKKDHVKAAISYTQWLAVDPANPIARQGRGDSYLALGKPGDAITDYEQALKIVKDSQILNNLAWLLATTPDEKLRDGKRAVELATLACELTDHKQAHVLSTLAAAYAEQGDFEAAVRWSSKALELAGEALKPELTRELESFKAGKPWREASPPNAPDSPKPSP